MDCLKNYIILGLHTFLYRKNVTIFSRILIPSIFPSGTSTYSFRHDFNPSSLTGTYPHKISDTQDDDSLIKKRDAPPARPLLHCTFFPFLYWRYWTIIIFLSGLCCIVCIIFYFLRSQIGQVGLWCLVEKLFNIMRPLLNRDSLRRPTNKPVKLGLFNNKSKTLSFHSSRRKVSNQKFWSGVVCDHLEKKTTLKKSDGKSIIVHVRGLVWGCMLERNISFLHHFYDHGGHKRGATCCLESWIHRIPPSHFSSSDDRAIDPVHFSGRTCPTTN